jgi:colanic acid/amylovoran biosynthesis glycosyltransferase
VKTLVLFTSSFPYGTGEAFIESEFPFLCKAFEKVIIITNEQKNKSQRQIPENVVVIRHPYSSSFYYKVLGILSVTSPIFDDEVRFIREKLRLSLVKNVLYTLLGSIAKGYETRDFLYRVLKRYQLSFSDTWFYSYWMNDMAIGLAMLKASYPQAKTFCRAHRGDLYFYTTYNHYLPLRVFLLKHLSKCYVISENGRIYLEELLGQDVVANVEVSRLGTFNYSTQLKPREENIPVIVSCSTLTLPKRVHLIAAGLARIKGLRLKWLHFGEGTLRAKVEKKANKVLANKAEVQYALMGNYSNSELMKYYAENPIDVFINVSSSEGIPVSIMEAMSFGIPVIATDAGGTGEIVKDGYNGYLLSVIATPDEIARAITKYFALSATEKEQMRNNAFKTWNEHYNAERNYQTFIDSVLAI